MLLFLKRSQFIFVLLLAVTLFSCKNYQEVSIGKAEGMKLVNYSQKGIEAQVGIRIKNPNKFGFKVYKSSMQVSIDGADVGEAKLKKKVRIKPTSDDVHYFDLGADFSKLNPADLIKLSSAVQKRSVNATIKGEIKVGNLFFKKKIPFNLTQRIDLNKGS
jgi:LEA14-like dessication related protein